MDILQIFAEITANLSISSHADMFQNSNSAKGFGGFVREYFQGFSESKHSARRE